ncbi:hypothetical protein H2200_010655 [Cladophialophora chaetospira]|uniref:aldehyde dehydrogenase (NAD(+)) n=1 Tax=Cladophialophora chaetospira TaxID=386627 RepID=A0AA38X0I0_9EURO|nr:hypothetical protein H2200_010655 [Cladophialophora chaetospira]
MPPTYPEVLKVRYSSPSANQSLTFPIHNPATGETITKLVAGTSKEVEAAVQAAQKAYETDWRWRSPAERSALLFKCADALEPHKDELAELLCLENGKPKQDALAFDINFLVGIFRFFASICDKLPGEFYQRGSVNATVIYEPFGVCVGILPFNWPPIHFGGKTAPALAAGNVMILKPGEQAPLTVIRMCEIISEVLPPDVVQVVPGIGPDVPSTLIKHDLVKMVSFTGSTAAGSKAAETAAKTVTPVVLELGGKNALVVFDDVENLDRAVGDALEGAFFNKGEACTASSRILVQNGVYKQFCDKLAAGVKKIKSGNGLDSSTHLGPQVSKAQQERVLSYLQKAKDLEKQGKVKIAAQGALPDDPACKNGYFVPPTLITDVTRDLVIAQEEMFGVLVTVTPFETEDEAIDIVNESRYGLTSIIFSQNNERCWRFSKKVDVGLVFVNNYFRNILGVPFGGAKETGYGREHSIDTLKEWCRAKVITQPSGFGQIPSWRAVKDVYGA